MQLLQVDAENIENWMLGEMHLREWLNIGQSCAGRPHGKISM